MRSAFAIEFTLAACPTGRLRRPPSQSAVGHSDAMAPPDATQAENYSGVVISNDLQTNGGRFLIIDNGRKIDVQIGVPPADPAVHGCKVVRLDNQDAGATRHIMPAAKQLPSCREFIRSLL